MRPRPLSTQGADVPRMQHTDLPRRHEVRGGEGHLRVRPSLRLWPQFGPNAQLTSIVDNWIPYDIMRVKAVLDGTWKTGDTWDGIKEGTVVIAPLSKKSSRRGQASRDGTRRHRRRHRAHPFTGPINKQDGTPWLKAGEKASDKDLSSMNFDALDVEGSLPNERPRHFFSLSPCLS